MNKSLNKEMMKLNYFRIYLYNTAYEHWILFRFSIFFSFSNISKKLLFNKVINMNDQIKK